MRRSIRGHSQPGTVPCRMHFCATLATVRKWRGLLGSSGAMPWSIDAGDGNVIIADASAAAGASRPARCSSNKGGTISRVD